MGVFVCLSVHLSLHHFSVSPELYICYEVGCIDNKLRFWIREAQASGEMAGSQGGCVLIRDFGQ